MVFGTSVWSNTGSDFNTASNYSPTVGNNAGGSGTTFFNTILYFEGDTVEPTMAANGSAAGIYATTGLTQNLTVTNVASSALTLTLQGNLDAGTTRAALAVDDPGNFGLTIGAPGANINLVLTSATTFFVNNAGTLTVNGTITGSATSNQTLTLKGNNSSGSMVFNGGIADGAATQTQAINIDTSGNVVFNAASTYSGGTTLTLGNVTLGANSAFGSGTITLSGNTSLSATTAVSIANAVSLSATNILSINGNYLVNLTGTVTLNGNANSGGNIGGSGPSEISGVLTGGTGTGATTREFSYVG